MISALEWRRQSKDGINGGLDIVEMQNERLRIENFPIELMENSPRSECLSRLNTGMRII